MLKNDKVGSILIRGASVYVYNMGNSTVSEDVAGLIAEESMKALDVDVVSKTIKRVLDSLSMSSITVENVIISSKGHFLLYLYFNLTISLSNFQ